MAPLWHPLGRLVESFWLAFSAFERLEPQREPFQPRFYDLVSFLVPFRSNFVKSLRFLTELLKVVWFRSVYASSSGYFGRASAAKRSEAAAGWMSGWMDSGAGKYAEIVFLHELFIFVLLLSACGECKAASVVVRFGLFLC